jgi:beta-lactam-binding protein with PASTA domain
MIGRVIGGRYALQARIGGGGTGIVYRAQDMFLNRPVAVKVLRPEFASDEQFVRRFRREARAAAALSHPNIVAVYDVGVDGEDLHYIVMEYVDGETLKDFIGRSGALPVPQAAAVATAILDALDRAHAAGVVHCDVKPQNVLLTRDGRVKVTDFGIARATTTATLAATGAVIGTAHYVSPEQANGRVPDERTDLYSCGVTLYEMLSGRVPFDGEGPLAVALRHVYDRPAPVREWNPQVPEALERVVDRAMAKNPGDRYPSAAHFRADLANAVAGRPLEPAPGETLRIRPRRRRRGRWPVAAAGLAVAGGLALGAYLAVSSWLNVPTVVVPGVLHETQAQALRDLRARHLLGRVADSRYSSAPKGEVVASEPPPGTPVREGRTVRLTLSLGPEYLAGGVPDVAGMGERDAELRLENAGLTVGGTQQRYSADVARGDVIATDPAAGARIAVGGQVTLVVSQGPKPVPFPLPDLVGQKLADAETVLQEKGLLEGSVSYAQGVWPSGVVSATSPEAKQTVQPGDTVDLTVSSGCAHTSTVRLVPPAGGAQPVPVLVTVTDQAGGPRAAFKGVVPPRTPFTVSFCWEGNVARWSEYVGGSPNPVLEGVLYPS